ncbi:MAG TPA: thiamine pyrophosphate-dependent enzyme [Candidatus Acidoferrales bacterium]|nr:thiamine pyrophosphate-dependent enzyme [Candidatus Acidoferrales bacterium]
MPRAAADVLIGTLAWTPARMANGLPPAIAAQVVCPKGQTISFVRGGGGFTLLMGEFATAVKYELPIKIVTIRNNTPRQIKWAQMAFLGSPEYGCELNPIDFARFARACGGTGLTIDKASGSGCILEEALNTPGAVVEAATGQFQPPLPAKITAEQAPKFFEALAKGTLHRKKITVTIACDRMREPV